MIKKILKFPTVFLLMSVFLFGNFALSIDASAQTKQNKESKTKKAATKPAPVKKPAAAKPTQKKTTSVGLAGIAKDDSLRNAPTVINSKSLEVDSAKRIFYYKTNVVVKQGDMTLLCDELEGHYDENNQVEKLIAKNNVVITKGETIKATSQRGIYDAKSEIITLTQNPQLEQNGSLLSADVVKIFIAEDRSVAEGDVQVTLINKDNLTPAPNAGAVHAPATISQPMMTATPAGPKTIVPGVSVLGMDDL